MRHDPVLGVILLEADHSVETVGWTDPFSWEPPAGLSVSFFGHPRHWPLPAVFAVARGATGTTSALGTQEAVQGVADAIGRLDGHCDLIVGGCGYFGDAWPLLDQPPAAFTLLSALDLVDATLASTSRDIVVMSASTAAARRVTGRHPQSSRIRLIGLDGVGEWANFARPDWASSGLVTDSGIVAGLRTVLERHAAPGGLLDGIGAVLLECTVLPYHRGVIREYTDAPIIDVERVLIGAL
jgi:hypothetical protein